MTEHDMLTLARKPWLTAECLSLWDITGNYPYGGTFTHCLAIVLPREHTDGHLLFDLVPSSGFGLGSYIAPDWITHARRLVLVEAQDPREAYFADEQDLLR
ncbi:hypothetical protein IU449_27010 [Nocardia higoensis]|uniref:Uncharacterized protein n=1 Tax=Nocardia higoensis TaxID=228599 RepID=A0ABS0DI58_9NOCA|nr:hypothetical protein [Nocardia higoensis]MBF6358151.1 hypothetical protein [Nocardia higoensis]